jgi:hypothetical protein
LTTGDSHGRNESAGVKDLLIRVMTLGNGLTPKGPIRVMTLGNGLTPKGPIRVMTLGNGLTPKGPRVPYVGFSDSGQVAVNAFYF